MTGNVILDGRTTTAEDSAMPYTPPPGVAQYLAIKDVGRALKVAPNTAAGWLTRYDDWPEPDVIVGTSHGIKGWSESRLPEWQAWLRTRPGRGRPGDLTGRRGRPREQQD